MKTQSSSAREKILRAASRVIVEDGLIGMTLNLVAHREGVSKGALFHYFENKHALVEELFNAFLRAFEADLKSATDRDQVPQGKFFQGICHDDAYATLWDV